MLICCEEYKCHTLVTSPEILHQASLKNSTDVNRNKIKY
jgi:hypothetical protein